MNLPGARWNTIGFILIFAAIAAFAESTHTVKPGETLTSIARTELGSGARWKEILELNKTTLSGSAQIKPGMVLKMPAAKAAAPVSALSTSARPAAELAGSEWMHIVLAGETLRSIARDRCGSVEKWKEIYELNRDKLSGPDAVKVGMELKLPVATKAAAPSVVATTPSAPSTPAATATSPAPAASASAPAASSVVPAPASAAPEPATGGAAVAQTSQAVAVPVETHDAKPVPESAAPAPEPALSPVMTRAQEAARAEGASVAENPPHASDERAVSETSVQEDDSDEIAPASVPPPTAAPRRAMSASEALEAAHRELERARAEAGIAAPAASRPAAPPAATTTAAPATPASALAPARATTAPAPAPSPATVSAATEMAAKKVRCFTQAFPMRSGSREDAHYGEELSSKLIAHWNASGRTLAHPSDADFTVLGQYWARDRELIIRADIQKGLRIVKSLQWRVTKNELEMGDTFFERMAAEIDAAMQ